jgi:tetratricopeptide (TPR) repeat protein
MPKKPKPSKGNRKRIAKPKAHPKSAKTKITSLKTKKSSRKTQAKRPAKARPTAKTAGKPATRPVPQRAPSKQFAGAVAALEVGIKLMYSEDSAKAVKAFQKVIADYPNEPEIQASAKARIQACEKKMQERARTVYRTADDHYNVAVALMNRGDLVSALTHLQSALKLAPKADHILYAIAAANALQGNKDQALNYLKQSIHHRPENRFQALQDNDFAVLAEEQAFKDLVAPSEK